MSNFLLNPQILPFQEGLPLQCGAPPVASLPRRHTDLSSGQEEEWFHAFRTAWPAHNTLAPVLSATASKAGCHHFLLPPSFFFIIFFFL